MRTATLGRALGRVKERRRSRHRSHARTARAAAASEQTPSQASGVARRATSRARRRWRAAEAGVAAAVRQARVDPNRPTVSHSRQRRSKLSDFGLGGASFITSLTRTVECLCRASPLAGHRTPSVSSCQVTPGRRATLLYPLDLSAQATRGIQGLSILCFSPSCFCSTSITSMSIIVSCTVHEHDCKKK
jgi:hypothetical protein